MLGAGFDTRALRVAELAAQGARVYVVGLPEHLPRKRAVFASSQRTLTDEPEHAHSDEIAESSGKRHDATTTDQLTAVV